MDYFYKEAWVLFVEHLLFALRNGIRILLSEMKFGNPRLSDLLRNRLFVVRSTTKFYFPENLVVLKKKKKRFFMFSSFALTVLISLGPGRYRAGSRKILHDIAGNQVHCVWRTGAA